MKKANNIQIAKNQPQGVSELMHNFLPISQPGVANKKAYNGV